LIARTPMAVKYLQKKTGYRKFRIADYFGDILTIGTGIIMFVCGPIKNLVLLGSTNIFLGISNFVQQYGVQTLVVTSPDQLSELPEALENVIAIEDIKSLETETLVKSRLLDGDTLVISVGARWILKEEVRNRLFGGKILNIHGTRLPSDRGGGGLTWRIMRGDRIGNLMLHEMDDGVDTGPVIISEDYVVPRHVCTQYDHYQDYLVRLENFVCDFLKKVIASEFKFERKFQPHYNSTYYPRIDTQTHGWIDWSWAGYDLDKFILAFDDPYPGARTLWRGKTVILKKCQLHVGEIGHHPFQKGIVIRNRKNWLVIALESEYSLVCEWVEDEQGSDILGSIREGDRFYTTTAQIQSAIESRVQFNANGLLQKE
jgi:methionyl-tRNA formyltransferase